MFRRFSLLCAFFLCSIHAALATDLPGSKDPPGMKRFEGAEIIHYATSPYDQYFTARGEGSIGVGFEKEGQGRGSGRSGCVQGTAGKLSRGLPKLPADASGSRV